MSAPIVASKDLDALTAESDPLRSIANTLAFSSADHGAERDRAWIYGIVLGWDCDEIHEHDEGCDDAMSELATKFRWSEQDVECLRRLHMRFKELEDGQGQVAWA